MEMAEITVEGVSKAWTTQRGGRVQALAGVDLSVEKNEFLAIIGTSGCGKTTLLNVLAGLEQPSEGRAMFRGSDILGPSSERGVVFQADAIFMWRTVRKNVEYGLEVRGFSRKKRASVAREYLNLVGLSKYEDLYPKELSGGMRKRCQIATVLANDPGVLLMDEPFGALDYATKTELQTEFGRILESTPKTTVFVTHDVEEALLLADRIVVMSNGIIRATVEVPFEHPRGEELRMSAKFAEAKGALWAMLQEGSDTHFERTTMGDVAG